MHGQEEGASSKSSASQNASVNYARYNLITLSLVAAIARAGSISGGAKAANLAMAAASKRLGDFEAQIDVPIFYRRPHGVELTEAGRAVLNDILNVLEDVERLARNVSEFASGGRGHVRIWANPAVISEALPEDVSRFVQAYPNIAVELEERSSSEIVKAVAENRADIGIFADTMKTNNLETYMFSTEQLVFCTPINHPIADRDKITLSEALEYPFVGLLARTPLAARLEYESARLGRSPQIRIQVRGVEAMCRMISAGLGIGVLPKPAVHRYLSTMKLNTVDIDESWSIRELYIGIRSMDTLPHAAKMLFDHLMNA